MVGAPRGKEVWGGEERGYLARERSHQALHRVLELPEEGDPDGVNAELKNGALNVKVPKAHPSEGRKTKAKVN
jgi:HSP20 family molecular chaperone IbpA